MILLAMLSFIVGVMFGVTLIALLAATHTHEDDERENADTRKRD